MFKTFFLISYIFLLGAVCAQNTFMISGNIFSARDSTALTGANIYLSETSIGTISDENGFFRLPGLPPGAYDLNVSFVGYTKQTIPVNLTSENFYIELYLNQEIISGPMVSVVSTIARERLSPVTYTSIGKREIKARYTVEDIPELLSDLPSTTFYSDNGNGLGYNYLSMRGFGQRRISVMINGIPQNDPEDHNVYWIDFPDFMPNVQQIQVQRGAGSSFYGPPAIGGSINIMTNYFSPERFAQVEYGLGSFNTRKYAMTYNSGLMGDRYVLYSRLSRMTSDGYREKAWVDLWSYFLGAAMYTKNSNFRLHFYGGPIEDGLAYFGLPKAYNTDENLRTYNYNYWQYDEDGDSIIYDQRRRSDEMERFNQPHVELLHEYRLSHVTTLNNNLFFIRGSGYFDYNGNWASPEYYRLTPEYGYDVASMPANTLIRAFVDNRQFGWLPNLTWTRSDGETIIGAELRYHRSLHWGRIQKGNGLPGDVTGNGARRYYEYKGGKDMASLYIHDMRYLTEKFILMADLQYAYKKYYLFDEKYLNTDFEVPYHFINPRFGINVNTSSSMNWYINIARTTREPRLKNLYDAAEASTTSWEGDPVIPRFEIDADGTYDFDNPLVKPETLTDVELGFGYRADGIQGYANLFYMKFEDEIIKKGGLDRFGQPITGNADRTTHKGIELNVETQLSPRFSLNGNLMYSRNVLDSYSAYEDSQRITLDGNPIAGFPDVLANLRFTYSWKNLYLSMIVKYAGKQYTDNYKNETNTVDPYTTINLNARYTLSAFSLKGFVLQGRLNNVFNKKYLMYGNGVEFFPAATRNGFLSLQYEF